jgi:cell filamentation protein
LAGQYRGVTTGRGAAAFCRAEFIEAEMSKRFAAIDAEHDLRGLATDRFAARAAEHLDELNAIHPFLDGNGRPQRAFLEMRAGHEIDLARVDPTAWNRASIEGFYKLNHEPLREVIAGALFSGARRG